MDASCTIQDSIHVFSLVHKYVSSILGTYQIAFSEGFYNSQRISCKKCAVSRLNPKIPLSILPALHL